MSCGICRGAPRVWWPLVFGVILVLTGAIVVARDALAGYSLGYFSPFLLAAGVLAVFNIRNRR